MSSFENLIKPKKKREKSELWLLSYADLVTNMMAFFIMLLAISKVDTSKFDAVASEMSNQKTDDLDALKKKIDEQILVKKLESNVKTDLGMSGLQVEFLNGVLFESASATLDDFASTEALPILDILKNTDTKYLLSFEGHTDDMPIRKGAFRDNWALSSARGVSLLEKMTELGVSPTRMSVAGFSDTRPKVPIAGKSGKDLESARASNRRVVIRVHQ